MIYNVKSIAFKSFLSQIDDGGADEISFLSQPQPNSVTRMVYYVQSVAFESFLGGIEEADAEGGYDISEIVTLLNEKLQDTVMGFQRGKVSVRNLTDAVRDFRSTYPNLSAPLITFIGRTSIDRYAETIETRLKDNTTLPNLWRMLKTFSDDMRQINEVLPEANFPIYWFEVTKVVTKQYIESAFPQLLQDVSDVLLRLHGKAEEDMDGECLKVALDGSTRVVNHDCLEILEAYHQLLDDDILKSFVEFRDIIVGQVKDACLDFFRSLGRLLRMVEGQSPVLPGFVLVLGKLAVYIEKVAIPKIAAEMAVFFAGGTLSACDREEISQIFRSMGDMFFFAYLERKSQKILYLLMDQISGTFNGVILAELQAVSDEVKEIDWSMDFFCSQYPEICAMGGRYRQNLKSSPKSEHGREFLVSSMVKLCLIKFKHVARLNTFNRSALQELQLDVLLLRSHLKEFSKDQVMIDILLDEVLIAAADRFIDPAPLEPNILDLLKQS